MARERVANTHNCSEREIAELFKNSKAYLDLPLSLREKVDVTKDFVWEHKCPCMKSPRINECADPIKSNIEFLRNALANLLSSLGGEGEERSGCGGTSKNLQNMHWVVEKRR